MEITNIHDPPVKRVSDMQGIITESHCAVSEIMTIFRKISNSN